MASRSSLDSSRKFPTVALSRRGFLQALPAAGLFLRPEAVAGREPRKLAIVVGVGEYQRSRSLPPADSLDLLGPKNDSLAVAQMLKDRYGLATDHLWLLRDAQATRKEIFAGWDWVQDWAEPGDLVIFYFSGHGTRLPERIPGSKPDGYDSALCPYDAVDRAGLIAGYEIGERIDRLRTDQVVVLVDACSSGSASRSLGRPKFAPPNAFGLPPLAAPRSNPAIPAPAAPPRTNAGEILSSGLTQHPGRQKERYLGAAGTLEEALDYPILTTPGPAGGDNRYMGLMTYYLLEALREDTAGTLTYTELARRLTRKIALKSEEIGARVHHPQLSGPGLSSVFFMSGSAPSGSITPGVAAKVDRVSGDTVTLVPVPGVTLTVGSLLAGTGTRTWVMSTPGPAKPATAGAPSGRGQVRVTAVSGGRATGIRLQGILNAGEVLREVFRPTPTTDKLQVSLRGDTAAIAQLRESLTLPFVELVSATATLGIANHVALTVPSGGQPIRAVWGGVLLPDIPPTDLPALLRRCWVQAPLLGLRGVGTGPQLTLTAVRPGVVEPQSEFFETAVGERIGFRMAVDRPAYVTLLSLNASGAVTGAALADRSLQPGGGWSVDNVSVQPPAGLDILMALAAPFPLQVAVPKGEVAQDTPAVVQAILGSLRASVNPQGIRAERSRGNDFSESVTTVSNPTAGGATAAAAALAIPLAVEGWSTAFLYQRTRG